MTDPQKQDASFVRGVHASPPTAEGGGSLVDRNAHIPTAEIKQDIADTEAEIAVMQQELRAYEALPFGSADYMMAQKLRIPNRRQGIADRQEFIAKLRAILAARAASQVRP